MVSCDEQIWRHNERMWYITNMKWCEMILWDYWLNKMWMQVDTKWWIVAPNLSLIPNHEKISEIIPLSLFQLEIWCKHCDYVQILPSTSGIFLSSQFLFLRRSFNSCIIWNIENRHKKKMNAWLLTKLTPTSWSFLIEIMRQDFLFDLMFQCIESAFQTRQQWLLVKSSGIYNLDVCELYMLSLRITVKMKGIFMVTEEAKTR